MINKLFLCVSFLLLASSMLVAQKTVKGTISDSSGLLPGVSILEKGTNNGVQTDFEGNFSIDVSSNDAVLSISYLGFKTQEVSVVGKTILNIFLQEDAESLGEIVVTAQGIRKSKKALGYAITKLDAEEVSKRPEADLARTLQGKISGVIIGAADGQTGSSSPIRIRGNISLTGDNNPLIVVNNVPFNGLLRDIDPNDIQDMSILKGFNAAVLYGSAGRNGVILIQTKSGNGKIGENKTTASFSTTSYLNVVSQLPEYQNKYGQGQEGSFIPSFLSNWGPEFDGSDVAHPYAGLGSIFPQYGGATIPYAAKPDNVKNMFRNGFGTINSLSVSTSKEKLAFNLSAGYTDEKGIVLNNGLKRFNLGIGGNAQISEKFNLSATLNYSTRKVKRIQSQEVFRRSFYLPRNIDLTELPYQNPLTGESVYYRNDTNPLWVLNNSGVTDDRVRVFGTVNLNYKLTDNLDATYRVGYDSEHLDIFDYSNKGGFNEGSFRDGYLNLDYIKEVVVDQTFILNYNKKITTDISLDAQVGINSKLTNRKRIS
ncbi:MAG: TonB-linked SusC/RagA family outer membrane protein, partial [Patiriisocius sp.]